MPYVLFYLKALWYTLGIIVICGLGVSFLQWLFTKMLGNGAGYKVILATSILGTPIHELGHVLMCLLFGHRITAMRLWQPRAKDGTIGFVTHTFNRRNPYHVLGNLFIGVGPICSGMAVLTLAVWLGFPDSFSTFVATAPTAAQSGDVLTLLFEGISLLPHMGMELIKGGDAPLWLSIIALILILAVSQHISLSVDDIKGALRAIPLYLLLLLLLTVLCGLLGDVVMEAVLGGLALLSGYMTAFFAIALAASLMQIVLAVPFWILRLLFSRR